MRRMKRPTGTSNHEFELDLAPLLAVMVKLVPVLLLSSAFVQVMVLETDLPQAVKEAIEKQEKNQTAQIQLRADKTTGIQVVVLKNGQETVQSVPLKNGSFDFPLLHKTLQAVKKENPEVFRIEMAPDSRVAYADIVKMTDEARRSRDKEVRFPIQDTKENKVMMTDFMFPDVVFTNIFDG